MSQNNLSNQRKAILAELALSYTLEHHIDGIADLYKIAQSENVQLYFDHYEKSFEGMTVCDDTDFFYTY